MCILHLVLLLRGFGFGRRQKNKWAMEGLMERRPPRPAMCSTNSGPPLPPKLVSSLRWIITCSFIPLVLLLYMLRQTTRTLGHPTNTQI
jgi:hypothetical protein